MEYILRIKMTSEKIIGIIEDENGNQQEVSEFYQRSWIEQLSVMDLKSMGRFLKEFIKLVISKLPECSDVKMIQLYDNVDGWAFLDNNGRTLQSGNLKNELIPKFADYLKAMHLNGIAGQLEQKAGFEFSVNTPLLAALWFKNEHVNQYKQLTYFVSFQEYLHYLFTGKNQIMPHLAARTGLYNLKYNYWDPQALAFVGLEESMLPKVVSVVEFESQILPSVIKCLGLNKYTQVKW